MTSVFHFIKLALALITGAAATVCLFVALPYVLLLAAVSILWSLMPE